LLSNHQLTSGRGRPAVPEEKSKRKIKKTDENGIHQLAINERMRDKFIERFAQ
jgi:hypothetical protein